MSAKRLSPLLAHLLHTLPDATLEALAETELWVEHDQFTILAVPSEDKAALLATLDDNSVLATIDDGDEFTVIAEETAYAALPPLLGPGIQVEHSYRFIRLEATLPWDTVGYGAAISAALTAAEISAGFFSGYSVDYLLIGSSYFEAAIAALDELIAAAQLMLGI